MRVRRVRDVPPIDQTFTITHSNRAGSGRWGNKGRARREKPIKQNAVDGKQFLAAIFSIRALLCFFSFVQSQINLFIAAEDALIIFIPTLYTLLWCFWLLLGSIFFSPLLYWFHLLHHSPTNPRGRDGGNPPTPNSILPQNQSHARLCSPCQVFVSIPKSKLFPLWGFHKPVTHSHCLPSHADRGCCTLTIWAMTYEVYLNRK